MYKEIDELVEAITQDDIFQNYCYMNKALENEQTLALLSRHQMLQEDYLRLRDYGQSGELKRRLQDVKKDMLLDQNIQNYYQSYHLLQTLLEDVTQLVFQNISDELSFDCYEF